MNTKSILIFLTSIFSIFTAQAQGPGGVTTGLRMWLRADAPETLTVALNTTVPDYNTTYSIAWQNLGTPNSKQTVVNGWSSSVQNAAGGYTLYSSNTSSSHIRKPVFLERHYLMNYHPTIDFYTNWSTSNSGVIAAFLTTANAPMSTGKPANSTTMVVMNAAVKDNFSRDHQNLYFISWHPDATLSSYTDYRPGFGLRNNGGDGQPRFRFHDAVDIETKAFSAGQTTIVDYQITNAGSRIEAGDIQAGYNMFYVSNSSRVSTDTWYMNSKGSLGGSLYEDRSLKGMMSEVIMYEKALTTTERNAVSSYFAIKYGITLRPNTVTSGRFDYVLSNNTVFWAGNSGASSSKWVKFYHNIAAVIRDDASNLNNIQTHSTDIGSMVHLGLASSTKSELYFNGEPAKLGSLAYDKEVIVFGNDVSTGAGILTANQECGNFNYIFNRRWLVNKITQSNRPITMIVAAQNNFGNNLSYGASSMESAMYNELVSNNDLFLIVADSPEKLTPGNANYGEFAAVVPMRFVNGEHQCPYVFTENETYFTFGYKTNTSGCPSDVQFNGTKTLDWSQWTREFVGRTFYNNLSSNVELSTQIINLGNDITAKQTIKYEAGVRANRNYPRYITNPGGSIEIMRRYGTPGLTKVTATIEFSTPVVPGFFISGLDARSDRYDKVTITGYCGSTAYAPELSYAGNSSSASYKISGNTALVDKRGSQNSSARNGMVNVDFQGGVSKIVIDYVLTNRVSGSGSQRIYISPISIRQVPPPPPISDGFSFVKDVKNSDISICEPVEYTFYIDNTNVENKYFKLTDVLPPGMKWESLVLDSINNQTAIKNGIDIGNYSVKINPFEKTNLLEIDSLYIPCTSKMKIIAVASMEDEATAPELSKQFANRATIYYNQVENNPATASSMLSLDRSTLDDNTVFTARMAERKDPVLIEATAYPVKFNADKEVEITLKVNNPNAPVDNVYLDLDWDEGFTYIAGSYNTLVENLPSPLGTIVTVDVEANDPILMIAGNTTGNIGFTLPSGETVFKFKLRTPNLVALLPEYGNNGLVVQNSFAPLIVNYLFSIEDADPCILESGNELKGEVIVSYNAINHIVTNKHITAKIKK